MRSLLLVCVLSPLALLPAAEKKPDLAALARDLVHRSAGVQKGDIVQLAGGPDDLALLEELAVQVRKRGGHPFLTYGSERLARRLFDDVPAKFDAQPPRADLALARIVDVVIGTEWQDEDAFAGVPPARLVASKKAAEGVEPARIARSVRTVWLGNRLYPTKKRAKLLGLSEAELTRLFHAGLSATGERMQATGAAVKKTLEGGKKLRLRGPGGTDLTCSVERRPVLVSDGLLTPERLKKGGAAVTSWLPAGEVYVTPVPGTANGTVVCPLFHWQGSAVKNLRMTFKDGKLTSMKADSGDAALRAAYEKQRAGKEQLGVIDVGINEAVKHPKGGPVLTYVPAGMVTVCLGGNVWAGGDNAVNFGVDCHLPGCTLEVDGKAVVEKGTLTSGR